MWECGETEEGQEGCRDKRGDSTVQVVPKSLRTPVYGN